MKAYEFTTGFDHIYLAFKEFIQDKEVLNKAVESININCSTSNNSTVYTITLLKNSTEVVSRYCFNISTYQDCCGIKIVSDFNKTYSNNNFKNSYIKYIPILIMFILARSYKIGQITFAHTTEQIKIGKIIKYITKKMFIDEIKPLVTRNPNSGNIICSYIIPIKPTVLEEPETMFKKEFAEAFYNIDDAKKESFNNPLSLNNWESYYENYRGSYNSAIKSNKLITDYYRDLMNVYFKFII